MSPTKCAAKNDKLGWTCGTGVKLNLGKIAIRSNSEAALQRMIDLLPAYAELCELESAEHVFSLLVGGESERKGVQNYHLLYSNWERLARTLNLEEAFASFRSGLCNSALAIQGYVLSHGTVVQRDGRAVLLSGPWEKRSEVGSALLDYGYAAHADVWFQADDEGLILPYALDEAQGQLSQVSLKAKPVRVSHSYLWMDVEQMVPGTRGQAVLELFRLSGGLSEPALRLEALSKVVRDAQVVFVPLATTAEELTQIVLSAQ